MKLSFYLFLGLTAFIYVKCKDRLNPDGLPIYNLEKLSEFNGQDVNY